MDERELDLIRLKRIYKYMHKKCVSGWRLATVITLIICLLFIPLSIGVSAFDNAIASAWGGSFWRLAKENAHAMYFSNDFNNSDTLTKHSKSIEHQVLAESAVLLMNTNNALPLRTGTTANILFDVPSDTWTDGNNLKTAFENNGISVSEGLGDALTDTAVVISTKNQETLDLLQLLYSRKADGKLQKIILLICTPNGTQIDYSKDNRLDGVLWLGQINNAQVVADILTSKINPSGRLAETYRQTAVSSADPFTYDNANIPESAQSYTICQEGIYADYKYYETRYEDFVMGTGNTGKYNYQKDVAYPFGFGLSYSTFLHTDFSATYDISTDRFEVSVTVINISAVAGKDVVQVYGQSPYTDYDKTHFIEKSAVNLVGFAKTKLLAPGERETITVYVDKRDLASYDWHGAGTYMLDAGDYYLTVASDAHTATQNILCVKGYPTDNGNPNFTYKWTQELPDTTTYATAQNGSIISNRFSSSDPNLYEAITQSVTWISRQDWEGTLSQAPVPFQMTPQLLTDLQKKPYSPADYPTVSMPTTGATNGLKLYNMRGLAFDDPLWQSLLDQLTFDEMVSLVADSYGFRMPVESVQVPGSRHCDEADFMPVSTDFLATTFNAQLAYDLGKLTGDLCLYKQVVNLSVSCCASADSFLSGKLSARLVAGTKAKGVDTLLKPFAQTTALWLNEQTLRERYLRIYQYAFTEGQAGGIITSANPLGVENDFATHILRGEWGCLGIIVTDTQSYTSAADNLMAGTTAISIASSKAAKELSHYQNDPVVVSALRQACHYNLYTLANNAGMNGIGEKTLVKVHRLPWVNVCVFVASISGLLSLGFGFLWYLGNKKFKKTEAYTTYLALKEEIE